MKNTLSYLALAFFGMLAMGSGDSSGGGSSSSGTSKSNSEAFAICKSRLRSDTNSGKYDHLSDSQMMRRMDSDLESCMAGYGHYPK